MHPQMYKIICSKLALQDKPQIFLKRREKCASNVLETLQSSIAKVKHETDNELNELRKATKDRISLSFQNDGLQTVVNGWSNVSRSMHFMFCILFQRDLTENTSLLHMHVVASDICGSKQMELHISSFLLGNSQRLANPLYSRSVPICRCV